MSSLRGSISCSSAFACLALLAAQASAAKFGVNFSSDNGGWGPYYVNSTGAFGVGPYESAFGVPAANWYEPGIAANTYQLAGAPASVNFHTAEMGPGSVNIAYESNHGWPGQDAYTWAAYGFSNANSFVMQEDGEGNRLLDAEGNWIPVEDQDGNWIFAPDNGVPASAEHAVLAGFLWGTSDGEYIGTADPWPARPIVVTLTGLSSIASDYKVTLYASSQNVVDGYSPATVEASGSPAETVEFTLLPDAPSYWSPTTPNPANAFTSRAGVAETTASLSGDTLTITLEGGNEYFDDEGAFRRTTLAGIVVEYTPSVVGQQGDYDGDADVDGADFLQWQRTYGATVAASTGADGDGDGTIGPGDLGVWSAHYPAPAAQAATAAVPEPASATLLVLLAALSARLRPVPAPARIRLC